MSALKQNISFAIRTLFKNKSFTITAVLTLALGIGATTAIFSVVYAVFEPMPYPKPDQLVMVWTMMPRGRNSVAAGDFLEWRRRSASFQDMNGWTSASFNVATEDRPQQIAGARCTPGFFAMRGLPLLLGRNFLPEEGEPGRDHVVILSHNVWSKYFNSNHDLIGKNIRMNGEQYTVVGVLPPGMHDRLTSQVWVPMSFSPEETAHDTNFMPVMARLKDGVTIDQAQAEMNGIAAQLQQEFPRTNANRGVSVESLHLDFVTDSTRRNLWLLLGAVGFLLLIGCVNVANLLLARGASRQKEIAVRAALGASRPRLFAQFLTESLVLAALGGALGVFLARAIIDGITLVMPPVGTMIPSEADIRISIPVLLFTIGVTTVAGLLFGTAPAWQATRVDLNEILQLGGRSGSSGIKRNAFRALIIAEFALALTLLATGGLALKGFWNLNRIDLGIQPDNVLTFRLPVPDNRLDGPEQIRSYYGQMLEKIQTLPGVTKVALTTGYPGLGPGNGARFTVVGQPINPQARLNTGVRMVTPEYVDTLGIRMVNGRNFNEHDTPNSVRVITVNEDFVKQYLAGADPLTQRISFPEIIPNAPRGKPVEWQIVGVYHNLRGAGFREDFPEINIPFAQNPWPQASIALKTSGDPRAVIKSVTAAVNAVDPDMPLAGVQTIDEIVSESLAIDRFSVVLFASFGALGLILAAVGIYGVMAFAVAQRTHEFGVRMALGAQRSRVVSMVLKEGALLATVGTLIGLGGGYLVGRAMRSTLYGVGAFDMSAFIGVSALLLAAALLACWFPARRASRVEPLEALRYE